MNAEQRISVRWPLLVAAAIVLVAAGAAAAYFVLRSRPTAVEPTNGAMSMPSTPVVSPTPEAVASGPLTDVVVPLSREMIERAGIVVTPVTSGSLTSSLVAPGVVEANAYKVVDITPTAGGRVTKVMAELGQHVRQGQALASIYSPGLAEAQARYVSARAELAAHDRELARTEKLVEIGAASRQELERIHAEHTARRAAVESAASELRLLGVSERSLDLLTVGQATDPAIGVVAPLAGVVTERAANVGVNVDPSTKLFTVADLSSVWVVVDIYEQEFNRVRVGMPATVTTDAYPGEAVKGRVSYIDPQVSAATRTAKARIEVPNPRQTLRLGMLARASFDVEGPGQVEIPRSAVQQVGDRAVVYLVNPSKEGEFIEREVRLGTASDKQVSVVSGVKPGDVVVSGGSFHVRAERERLGLRAGPSGPLTNAAPQSAEFQTATVVVDDSGFQPAKLTLRSGVPARVTFTRKSEKTCATEVAFPSLNIKRALPLHQRVVVEFTPARGDVEFVCGMNMLKGTVVAR